MKKSLATVALITSTLFSTMALASHCDKSNIVVQNNTDMPLTINAYSADGNTQLTPPSNLRLAVGDRAVFIASSGDGSRGDASGHITFSPVTNMDTKITLNYNLESVFGLGTCHATASVDRPSTTKIAVSILSGDDKPANIVFTVF